MTRRLTRRWPSRTSGASSRMRGEALGDGERRRARCPSRPRRRGSRLCSWPRSRSVDQSLAPSRRRTAHRPARRRAAARRRDARLRPSARRSSASAAAAIEDRAAQGQDRARHARISSTRQTRSRRDPSGSAAARMAKRRRPESQAHGAGHALAIAQGDAMRQRLLGPVGAHALACRRASPSRPRAAGPARRCGSRRRTRRAVPAAIRARSGAPARRWEGIWFSWIDHLRDGRNGIRARAR